MTATASWTDMVTAISTLLLAVFGLPGLWFAIQQARQQRFDALRRDLVPLIGQWESPPMEESRQRAREFSTPEDLRDYVTSGPRGPDLMILSREPNFWDGVGLRLKLKLIKPELLLETLGLVALQRWEHWRPTVMAAREAFQQPAIWDNFEYLASVLRATVSEPKGRRPAAEGHPRAPWR